MNVIVAIIVHHCPDLDLRIFIHCLFSHASQRQKLLKWTQNTEMTQENNISGVGGSVGYFWLLDHVHRDS